VQQSLSRWQCYLQKLLAIICIFICINVSEASINVNEASINVNEPLNNVNPRINVFKPRVITLINVN